jgi:short-subunit dehydrogenase
MTGAVTVAASRFRDRYGPWAVVTGASEGIGRAFADDLARRGLNLVLVARRGAILEEMAARYAIENGIETRVLVADLSDPAGPGALAEATSALEVGLVVAAAGYGQSQPLIDSDIDDELRMVDLNCRSVLATANHFGRQFARRRRGGLVLLSSLFAFQGVPRAANYAATKAYVQSLAEGLRLELAPFGIDVVASAPGPVQSGFARRADMRMGLAARPAEVAQATLAALGRRSIVRPGWLAKALEASLTGLPRRVRARILGHVVRGMTSHRDGEKDGRKGGTEEASGRPA